MPLVPILRVAARQPRPLTLPRLRTISTTQPALTKPSILDAPNASTSSVPTEASAIGTTPKHEHQESVEADEAARRRQAPNRLQTWSRSQRPRALGMVGPRFEQTDMEMQPAPWAAIELIHKQPVKWSKERIVACDGGGGPLGHPRIFINVDKPQVEPCGYCGLPYAHVKHKETLKTEGADYPLE